MHEINDVEEYKRDGANVETKTGRKTTPAETGARMGIKAPSPLFEHPNLTGPTADHHGNTLGSTATISSAPGRRLSGKAPEALLGETFNSGKTQDT